MKLIAKTFAGLEDILGREIAEIGGCNIIKIKRGIAFEGDHEVMYRANLCLRTAIRIYIPLYEFRAANEKILYNKIKEYPWENLFSIKDTFMVESLLNTKFYNNSQYIAFKTKDAIVDRFRDKFDDRPNIDKINPNYRIQIHIYQDTVNISIDTSGKPLFMRGYREDGLEAPINECLAAGLVMLSNWDKKSPFFDVMCGSGTIPIEAAMIASDMPPNIHRKAFAFEQFKDFDKSLFNKIKEELLAKIHDESHLIFATDISGQAIDTAKMNFYGTKLRGMQFMKTDFFDFGTHHPNGIIIFNPPYDERLKIEDIEDFYRNIGHHLKNIFGGFTAWIISSNKTALKNIGLKPNQKYKVFNGKLECEFCQYVLIKKKDQIAE
jgi:putative N6-adenine-specific DNA methylase